MFLAFITVCLLLILGGILVLKYRIDSLLHPGLWFVLAWVGAILCYYLLDWGNYVPIHNDKLLDRLYYLVLITAGAFLLMALIVPRPASWKKTAPAPPVLDANVTLYRACVLICFSGAIINWIGVGMPLGYRDEVRQQWLENIPRVTALSWYPFHLAYPTALLAGIWISHGLFAKRKISLINLGFCSLPGAAAMFWILGTGGRQMSGFVILFYMLGGVIGAMISVKMAILDKGALARLLRIGLALALVAVGFAWVASFTNRMRAQQQKRGTHTVFYDYPILNHFGPFIGYMGGTLMTQQAYGTPIRRNSRETGPVFFNGLLDWGIKDFTLYKLLGLREVTPEDTNPERAMARHGQDLAYGTRNIYYDLEADFGFEGAIKIILLLVFVANLFYWVCMRWLSSAHLLLIIPLLYIVVFWGYSHQFSLMMHGLQKWLVSSFLAWTCMTIACRYLFPASSSAAASRRPGSASPMGRAPFQRRGMPV